MQYDAAETLHYAPKSSLSSVFRFVFPSCRPKDYSISHRISWPTLLHAHLRHLLDGRTRAPTITAVVTVVGSGAVGVRRAMRRRRRVRVYVEGKNVTAYPLTYSNMYTRPVHRLRFRLWLVVHVVGVISASTLMITSGAVRCHKLNRPLLGKGACVDRVLPYTRINAVDAHFECGS